MTLAGGSGAGPVPPSPLPPPRAPLPPPPSPRLHTRQSRSRRPNTYDHAPYYSDRLLADPAANERLVYAQQFDVQFEEDDDVWNHRPETLEEFLQYDLHETWLIEVNHAGQVWPQHAVE